MRNNHTYAARRYLVACCRGCAIVVAAALPALAVEAPMELRMGQAVLMALTNNRAFTVQRLAPEIQRTFEETERALFDPVITGRGAFERDQTSTNGAPTDAADTISGSLGVSKIFSTGTRVGLAVTAARESSEVTSQETYASRVELTVAQALLQGRPRAVNLVRLHQARLETDISEYELRAFAEKLVADVEAAYWECALARRRVTIVEQSLTLAEQQLREIDQRIKVGNLPETELAAIHAEVALRREALINARSNLATAGLGLLRLINPAMLSGTRRELALLTDPAIPGFDPGTVASHVATALRLRPDVNQARLKLQGGDLELIRTKNGLLPKMDLFITLGDTGYAQSFGNSVEAIDGSDLHATAGLNMEYPFRNRAARAQHRRTQFTRAQTEEALRNMEDLVRVDVEAGLIEVARTREQVTATATTHRLQEEKLRAETAKFKVGRSTALQVAQSQRDLLLSQVAEVDAVVRHLQALVNFFRLEGSLLDRRGLAAPGRRPAPPGGIS